MNLQQMIDAVNRRVDDVPLVDDVIEWLNAGKNNISIAVGAKFPDLTSTDFSEEFAFDSKWHELPVLYASAKFKEQDASLNEADNFLGQFEMMKRDFVSKVYIPPSYRDDHNTQQFIATEGQTDFTITNHLYDPIQGDLLLYLNDAPITSYRTAGNVFVISATMAGDKVTAVWEVHTDLIQPPYAWWGRW